MLSCHESGTSAEAFRCMKAVLLVATQAESGSLRSDSAATAHIAKLELTAARLMLVVWDRELQIRVPSASTRDAETFMQNQRSTLSMRKEVNRYQ